MHYVLEAKLTGTMSTYLIHNIMIVKLNLEVVGDMWYKLEPQKIIVQKVGPPIESKGSLTLKIISNIFKLALLYKYIFFIYTVIRELSEYAYTQDEIIVIRSWRFHIQEPLFKDDKISPICCLCLYLLV